ncbi:BrnT family toxin [Candidatus Uhrbacteria bacterium]|nr:BrnT family toxin [Candidatus Uhrbacteria bacterium]
MLDISTIEGFQWDRGNSQKNITKHKVTNEECEQVFFNTPLLIQEDALHSTREHRWYALGKTNIDRLLFVSFTMRRESLRIISARDMSRKERHHYEQA